jgi:formiminotetrahydrofolate cyclodeaminase
VTPPPAGEIKWGRITLARTDLSRFFAALASRKPVPAGGSAAAAAVAMAAGLVEKAARLSTDHWIGAANIGKRAAVLRKLASILVDADATAYTDYVKALRAAKGLHTAERERILGPVRVRIIEVPLTVVRSAAEVADMAAAMAEHGNPNLRSDAIVALELAAAAARSGGATLSANVRSGLKDERLVEARRLAREATALSRRLSSRSRPGGRDRARARSRDTGRR